MQPGSRQLSLLAAVSAAASVAASSVPADTLSQSVTIPSGCSATLSF
jgi:hypothetical protein